MPIIKPADGIEAKIFSRENALPMVAFYAAVENRPYLLCSDSDGMPYAEVSPRTLKLMGSEESHNERAM